MEKQQSGKIPVKHIVGFLLSLGLTIVAAWTALKSDLPVTWVIAGIMVLAVIQVGIQLFMFMHMTESASGNGNITWNMMFHAFMIATIVVAGSLFTMSLGSYGNDMDNMDKQEEQHMEMENEMDIDHKE